MAKAENWTNFIGNYKERILDAFAKNGMNGVQSFIVKNLDHWKNIPMNIAVTGNSGTGKSSFINTLNGTYADDENGAKADVVQCTGQPTDFVHPTNKNLILWDLPGVGTPDFPRETYLEKVKFDRYDCFIIVSATRFTENELWLANAITSKNGSLKEDVRKSFYFVRTQVDCDISKIKKSHRRPEPEFDTLERIRKEIQDELKKGGFPMMPIYLIENYEAHKYDFGLLTRRLVQESPAEKREAMALSLSVLTEEIIDAKEITFKERMWKICLASACGGAVPVPGLSAMIDGGMLVHEASLYREQLGLHEEGLERTAKLLHIPLKDLQETLDLKSVSVVLTVRGLMALCSGVVFTEFIESSAKFGIPVVGSVIAGSISFYSTKYILQTLLTTMVSDARKINTHISELLKEVEV